MSKSLSILVVTTSFPYPGNEAAGQFVLRECLSLQSLGVKICVLAPHIKGAPVQENIQGINVRRFKYSLVESWQNVAYGEGIPTNIKRMLSAKIRFPIMILAMIKAVRKEARNYDLIHAHWFIAGLATVLGKARDQKTIMMMHQAHDANKLFLYILKRTNFLICNSSTVLQKTLAIFPSIDSKIIHPGIDTDFFIPLSDNKNKLNQAFQMIAVGRFIPCKGFSVLIEACGSLKKSNLDFQLKLIGQGPLQVELEQQISKLDLKNHVKIMHNLPQRELKEQYQGSDLLIIPSIIDKNGDTEGLGMVAVEAGSCGLPLIGSNVGGIPDVIKDGHNGFLFEANRSDQLAEKIKELTDNPSVRRKMGKAARSHVLENFNTYKNARNILEIYQKLTSDKDNSK
jgi:glycosyltransferase involved in cell wall biosynthesis